MAACSSGTFEDKRVWTPRRLSISMESPAGCNPPEALRIPAMPALSRFAVACLLSVAGVCTTSAISAAEPVRVGVLGLDNYQAVAYAQLFNSPKAEGDLAGLRVVAAVPLGSPDIPESVEGLPKWK